MLKVRWLRFCDDLSLVVESTTSEKVFLSLDYVDWHLFNVNSNQLVASSHDPFEDFRIPVERLVGTRITNLAIRPEEGLSLSLWFSNGQSLLLEPCIGETEDGTLVPGWEVFCSDGSVITVKMQQGRWNSKSRRTPYSP